MNVEKKITRLLIAAFSALILLMLCLIVFSIAKIDLTNNNMKMVLTQHAEKIENAYLMRDAIQLGALSFQKILNTGDVFEMDAEKIKIDKYMHEYQQFWLKQSEYQRSEVEIGLFQQLNELTEIVKPIVNEVVETLITQEFSHAKLASVIDNALIAEDNILKKIEAIIKLQKEYAFSFIVQSDQDYQSAIKVLWLLGGLFIAIGIIVAFSIIRLIQRKNNCLIRAYKSAEMSAKKKSEFLAVMSHEIRTPMNGIVGIADLLEETELTVTQQDYVKTIVRSGASLLTIINDILDLSKVEAGKLELEEIPFNIFDLVDDIGELFADKAEEKSIALIVNINKAVHLNYLGDPNRLRQIIINLVGNALKFTERGEIVIYIGVSDEKVTHTQLKFEVRDTGIGLTIEQQQKIFKKYSQANKTTSREYGGTGLGLSISKQLVQMMGGDIGVVSTVNEGAKFWFTVNLNHHFSSEVVIEAKIKDLNVLYVESNANTRLAVSELFCRFSIRVDIALTVAKIEKQLGRKKYDLLIVNDVILDEIKMERLSQYASMLIVSVIPNKEKLSRYAQYKSVTSLKKPFKYRLLSRLLHYVAGIEEVQLSEEKLLPHYPHLKILVVDDNPINRKVVSNMLEKLSIAFVAVENGKLAVDYVKENKVNLVLMDCNMPIMSGTEATLEIRKRYTREELPVVALTANAIQESWLECYQSGMNDVLVKPLKIQDLMNKLGQMGFAESSQVLEVAQENGEKALNVTLDDAVLDELRESVGSEFNVIIEMFLNDTEQVLAELEYAVQERDLENIWQKAHRLKGSTRYIGAQKFSEMFSDIEIWGRENEIAPIKKIMPELSAEFKRLAEILA